MICRECGCDVDALRTANEIVGEQLNELEELLLEANRLNARNREFVTSTTPLTVMHSIGYITTGFCLGRLIWWISSVIGGMQ